MKPNETLGSEPGAHPIDRLRREHAVILRVLDAAEAERLCIENGGLMSQDFWRAYLDFLDNYADRWHRTKEEQLLFPLMETHGIPKQSGATTYMRRDHAHIRATRARLAEALTGDDLELISHLIDTSIEDLRLHIEKENEVVYQIARHKLDHNTSEALGRSFDDLEQTIGEDIRDRGEALAASLAAGGQTPATP